MTRSGEGVFGAGTPEPLRFFWLPLTLALLALASPAVAQDETSREAEMFGADDDADDDSRDEAIFGEESAANEETPPGFAGDNEVAEEQRDDAFLGGETDTSRIEDRLASELDEQQDWLALGGLFYMRLEHNVEDDTPAGESRFTTPTLVDVYLDARPNDRVRGYVRGRLRHDFTIPEGAVDAFGQELTRSQVLLDQMWLKLDILRTIYVTVGKQPVRWGSGRFWNPTDFLNRQKIDPLALFDERNGVSMVKLHLPIEALNWNLYAVANLDGAYVPDEIGGAFRAEMLFGETEVALTYAKRKNNPHQLGFDISSGLWLFDVRAELAALKGLETPFYRGALDPVRLQVPLEYSRADQWILQGTGAIELTARYSDQDTVTFGVEYFYNDAGYKNADKYPWLAFNGQFTPLYLGRHYLGAYVFLPQPGLWNDTSFTLSGLGNLSDQSYLARFDYQVRVLTYLDVNVYVSYHLGDVGELNYGYTLEPLPFEGLEDGIVINQPVVDVGVALRIAI